MMSREEGLTDGSLDDLRRQTLEILGALLPSGTKAALVDFPNHRNHGDHLILLGELAYLKQLNVEISYIADPSRYDPSDLRHFLPYGPILLHGGGSFGDRWVETQAFRERVVADFPDRTIIQLPQGIEFSDGPLLRRAQHVYGAHPNLIHLIRDHAGVAETRRLFSNNRVLFCPDMALGFQDVGKQPNPKVDVLYLRRQDSESVPGSTDIVPKHLSTIERDWGFSRVDEVRWRIYHIIGAIGRRFRFLRRFLYPAQRRMYVELAKLNVKSALNILSLGRIIVTDRLHATVLAGLMGKKVVAIDNANGKVAAIVSDYLGGAMPNVRQVPRGSSVKSSIVEINEQTS